MLGAKESTGCLRRWLPHRRYRGATWLAGLLCLALLAGCSSKSRVHPALVLTDDDITRGISRGKSLIASGADPYDAFQFRLVDVNQRVSADVVLRSAGLCMPQDEVAYEVAAGGDTSDAGIRKAVAKATKNTERQLRAIAIVQVTKSHDPASVGFVLESNTRVKYPAILIEAPAYIRDVSPGFGANEQPAAMYFYTAFFPVRGGPGVPPVGPTVRSLSLAVKDGDFEGYTDFALKTPETSG
jgi:hypothetical protein